MSNTTNIPSQSLFKGLFCTISTFNCIKDFIGLIFSLSINHDNAKLIAYVDSQTKEYINKVLSPKPKLDLELVIELDTYSGKSRIQMEKEKIWSKFQLMKSEVIDYCFDKYPKESEEHGILFIDSDMFILDQIEIPINYKDYDIGLSPHYIKKSDTDKFGFYNGGFVWSRNKKFTTLWRDLTKTSRFYEQAALEPCSKLFKTFHFDENYNLAWWRIIQSNESPLDMIKYLSIQNRKIYYKNKLLKCIHTHFYDNQYIFFNSTIRQLFSSANLYKESLIINRMLNMKWQISRPKQPRKDKWNHNNDSFRKMMEIWTADYKDIEIIETSDNHPHLFNILLYDRDKQDWVDKEFMQYNYILVGNMDYQMLQKCFKNKIIKPWFYWPRHPIAYEVFKSQLNPNRNRTILSSFIGNAENQIQYKNRTEQNWFDKIEYARFTIGSQHKFTPQEYMNILSNSKFGLSLPGYGLKCHREIECMGFGTIPIVTPGLEVKSYIEPLEENKHYIYVENPNQIEQKIKSLTSDDINRMSQNCVDWYNRNVKQSWLLTINYILYD